MPTTSMSSTQPVSQRTPHQNHSERSQICVHCSVISVQQFIFILVFIQFSVNHFYFYSVLVLSTFIHFSSYLILVQAFTIILVLIQFSFLINQIYEITVTGLSAFSLRYYCSASGRHASQPISSSSCKHSAEGEDAFNICFSASDVGADNETNASCARLWYMYIT